MTKKITTFVVIFFVMRLRIVILTLAAVLAANVGAETLRLHLIDGAETPVRGARVDLCAYFEAAFRSVGSSITDRGGNAVVEGPAGDALLWVSLDGKHQAVPVTLGEDADVTLVLDNTPRIGVADIKIRPMVMPELPQRLAVPEVMVTDDLRELMERHFDAETRARCRANPLSWAMWVNDNIITADSCWAPGQHITPATDVMATRRANVATRDAFFVAGGLAMDIEVRLNPMDARPQYRNFDGNWAYLDFSRMSDSGYQPVTKGTLKIKNTGVLNTDPVYGLDFTVSQIRDGRLSPLVFEFGASLSTTFADGLLLMPGQYMIVNGRPAAGAAGTMTVHTELVLVLPGRVTTLPLSFD